MKQHRVLVIGSPGSGKSTFSRKLRDVTGLPLYYLDMLYHNPDRTTVNRAEFDERLSRILELDQWIIDGTYRRTLLNLTLNSGSISSTSRRTSSRASTG